MADLECQCIHKKNGKEVDVHKRIEDNNMDFGKLKDIAKTATEKTVAGVSKANEKRKKASKETKISVGNQTIRKTIDGKYYLGFYSENPDLYDFAGFEFAGSTITQKTVTKGKTKQQGRTGSALVGGMIGATINPVGAVVGAVAGGARKKKGKVDTTSITTTEEKPGKAILNLRNVASGEIKTVKAKLTQAEANNVKMFFLS